VLAAVAAGFTEFPVEGLTGGDGPLGWAGYGLSRERAAERTGTEESVVCGRGVVGGRPAVLVAFEFGFLGGSVGTATGLRVVDAFTRAREERLPVVSLIATGGHADAGGRARAAAAPADRRVGVLLRAAGLPHVAVLRDPTTGGVWASLGAGADVVVAVRGAQVGFAGPPADGWQAVRNTRSAARPRAEAYLADHFTSRRELRAARVADGVLCGFGLRHGDPVAYAAQTGTPTTPAGFRAATRLVRTADRLRLPVLTLGDTPGAAAGPAAEHEGIGPAIRNCSPRPRRPPSRSPPWWWARAARVAVLPGPGVDHPGRVLLGDSPGTGGGHPQATGVRGPGTGGPVAPPAEGTAGTGRGSGDRRALTVRTAERHPSPSPSPYPGLSRQ
jgi:acetyl-CoA carboxylase carboxyl transferase subunit beta